MSEVKERESVAKEGLKRYKWAVDTWARQRTLEKGDLAFMDPNNQWSEAAKSQRQGAASVGAGQGGERPCLSVSKIEQPIQLVLNQFQNSHLAVNIHPLSAGADKDTAMVYQGIYRKVERDSMADQARGWAFDRAIKCGFGAYLVNTDYDDVEVFTGQDEAALAAEPSNTVLIERRDAQFDQKVVIERILRQEMVVLDPSAQKADFSDGRFGFIGCWTPLEEFQEMFPDAEIAASTGSELGMVQKDLPEWVETEGGEVKAVLVVSYWCKHVTFEDMSVTVGKKTLKRRKPSTAVVFYKLAPGGAGGVEVVEERPWNGKLIPIIPVFGKEMQPFDSKRTWVGIVRPSMDSQRMYNYAISTAVEIAALEPKAPWIGPAGAFKNQEQKWNTINTVNWGYVEYNTIDVQGKPAQPPFRTPIDSGRLNVSLQLMAQASEAIQATTYTPDPALGKQRKDESGRAIEALQGQSEASTSNYVYGMAQVSMPLEAQVVLDLIGNIYDREGRLTRMLDLQDEEQEVILNAPFVMGQDGRPQTVPPQGQMAPMGGQQVSGPKPKHYDLTAGRYGVTVSIGKSYKSRFEQGRDQMSELLQADPALMGTFGDIFFKYNDAPWAHEAEERMKIVVKRQNPDFFKPKDGQAPSPEQLQAENEALKQQMQQAEQIMQQMKQEIETDQAKQQATIQKAQIDAQSKQAQTAQSADAEMMIAKLKATLEAELALKTEMIKGETQAKLEAMQAESDERLQAQDNEFKLLLEQMKQQFEAQQAELDRRAAAEQADKAAANAERMAEREPEGDNE